MVRVPVALRGWIGADELCTVVAVHAVEKRGQPYHAGGSCGFTGGRVTSVLPLITYLPKDHRPVTAERASQKLFHHPKELASANSLPGRTASGD